MKFLLPILFSSTVFAGGHTIGNGGNAIVCKDPLTGKTSVRLQDYYEAEKVLKWPVHLGEGQDEIQLALKAVARITPHHPITAMHYRKRIQNFMSDARIERGIKLYKIDDTNVLVMEERDRSKTLNPKLEPNYLFVEDGCQLVQLAIRRDKEKVPDHKTFSINGDLWDQMSPTHKAGLLLHEVIFEHMLLANEYSRLILEHPAPDSRDVRYMTALFSHPGILKLNDANYMRVAGLHNWFMEDFVATELLAAMQEYRGGPPTIYKELGQFPVEQDVELTIGGRRLMALRGSQYEVFGENIYKSIILAEDTQIQMKAGTFTALAGTELLFTSDGKILRATLKEETKFKGPFPGGHFVVDGNRRHGPVQPVVWTNFYYEEYPNLFFFRNGSIMDGLRIKTDEGDRSLGLQFNLYCPEKSDRPCAEIHPNGMTRSIMLRPEPITNFPMNLVDTKNNVVSLITLYKEAEVAYDHGDGPKMRLPKKLSFDEQGRAICPYVSPKTGECRWLEVAH